MASVSEPWLPMKMIDQLSAVTSNPTRLAHYRKQFGTGDYRALLARLARPDLSHFSDGTLSLGRPAWPTPVNSSPTNSGTSPSFSALNCGKRSTPCHPTNADVAGYCAGHRWLHSGHWPAWSPTCSPAHQQRPTDLLTNHMADGETRVLLVKPGDVLLIDDLGRADAKIHYTEPDADGYLD